MNSVFGSRSRADHPDEPRSAASRRTPLMTPLGAMSRGLVAGAVGTVAMDAVWFARYRRGGGRRSASAWEFSSDAKSWDEAPAPAQVGRRLVEGLFQRELPVRRLNVVNNATHWGYGMLAGLQYGVVAASVRAPRAIYGLPFGASIWAASYVVLPAAKLYDPIWSYDRRTLAKDLSAHLVYGLATATTLRYLSPSSHRAST